MARGAANYVWNGSTQGAFFKSFPTNSSYIKLTGTNDQGCSNSITIDYEVKPKPKAEISGPPTVCKNSSNDFSVGGENLVQYVWDSGEMFSTVSKYLPET